MRGYVLTPEHTLNSKKVRAQTILCAIIIIFLIFHSCQIKVDNAKEWINGDSYAVNYENPGIQYIADNPDSVPFRVATVAYGLHPAYANAYGLETVDGYVCLYPKRYQDFWGKVIEPLTLQDEEIYNYFHYWGSRILWRHSGICVNKLRQP